MKCEKLWVSALNELFILGVFVAGLLSFVSPCILPVLPVYVGLLTDVTTDIDTRQNINKKVAANVLRTLLFVLGISTVFVILGFGAGALGSVINNKIFVRVMGIIIILLGIHQTGLLNFKFLNREKRVQLSQKSTRKFGFFRSFLLGFTFSFAWTPCIGPVLASVIGIASGQGSPIYGGVLMFVYSIGLALPFMLISFLSELLVPKFQAFSKHATKIKLVGGIIIIIMGILLLTDNLGVLRFGGLL